MDSAALEAEIEAVRTECRHAPNNAPLHFELGELLQESGDLKAAADAFTLALTIKPNYSKAQRALDSLDAKPASPPGANSATATDSPSAPIAAPVGARASTPKQPQPQPQPNDDADADEQEPAEVADMAAHGPPPTSVTDDASQTKGSERLETAASGGGAPAASSLSAPASSGAGDSATGGGGGSAAFVFGAMLQKSGDHNRAAQFFAKVVKDDPANCKAWCNLARSVALRSEPPADFEEAIGHYKVARGNHR